jgi:hypothetical protein
MDKLTRHSLENLFKQDSTPVVKKRKPLDLAELKKIAARFVPDKNSGHPLALHGDKVSFKRYCIRSTKPKVSENLIRTNHERVLALRNARGKNES